MNRLLTGVFAASLLSLAPFASRATVVNFNTAVGPAGNTGSSTWTDGIVTADALVWDSGSGSWVDTTNATLFVRNNSNDRGIGVCSADENSSGSGTYCGAPGTYSGGGGGDPGNELDNSGVQEMIRLSLAAGYDWLELGVSSLDGSEQGQIWFGSGADPAGGALLESIAAGDAECGGGVECTYAAGAAATYDYIYILSGNGFGNLGSTGSNDFLVKFAAYESSVPEPAILGLMLVGLAGVSISRRKR